MIRIKDIKKVQREEETKVKIRYFVTVDGETFFVQLEVDDFDVTISSLEDVKTIIEQNADQNQIKEMYKSRKSAEADTYIHDGTSFKKDLKFVDWTEEGLNTEYNIDDVVEYEGTLYRCVQAHTVNDINWTPVATAALWSPILVFGDKFQPWQQPQGAHDAYPVDSIVRHTNKLWKALVADNVWEPGTDDTLWEKIDETTLQPIVPPEPDPEVVPEWSPDSVAYSIGDHVMYENIEYNCIQAHTSQAGWNPPAVPALWETV